MIFVKHLSQATYHAMRDHPKHAAPILAGMFGTRMSKVDKIGHLSLMREILDKMLQESLGQWKDKGLDQDLLRKHLWPLFTNGSGLVHDSYLCNKFKEGSVQVRAFPTKRDFDGPSNYVGSNGGSITIKDGECPPGCRPKEHKNWRLC